MRYTKNEITALLILGILSASVLSSCASEHAEGSDTDENTDLVSAPITEVETEAALTDGLPEKDFGGAKYTILMCTAVNEYMKFTVDEEIGDSVNDIAYNRQADTEERFHVEIEVVPDIDHATEFAALEKYLSAGETFVDLIQPNGNGYGKAGTYIGSGLLMDWNQLDYIDFSKPWWNSTAIGNTSSGNKVYAAFGDLTLLRSDLYAMLCNKTIMTNHDIEIPYDLVETGKWTSDAMLSIMKGITRDVNGDGAYDDRDQYGLAGNQTCVGYFQMAFDNTVSGFNENGVLELVYSEERLQNGTEIVTSIIDQSNAFLYAGSDNDSPLAMFKGGRALFYFAPFGMYYQNYRDIEFDYGVLPLPKYDENQEKYITGKANSIYISSGIDNPEKTAIITEALTAYSYLHVRDVFITDMMEGKLARDERSRDMIDIILNSTGIEVMDVLLSENTLTRTIKECALNGKPVSSFIASNLKRTQNAIDKLNDILNEN